MLLKSIEDMRDIVRAGLDRKLETPVRVVSEYNKDDDRNENGPKVIWLDNKRLFQGWREVAEVSKT